MQHTPRVPLPRYSAAVLEDGRLFTWGCNAHGRLRRRNSEAPPDSKALELWMPRVKDVDVINKPWLILIGGCPLSVVGFRPLLEGTPP